MPRLSAVAVDDAVNVLIKYMNYFVADKFPQWSSPVWQKMSNEPEFMNKWNAAAVRTNVTKNRGNILSIAREQCGYFVGTVDKNIDNHDNNNDDDDTNDDSVDNDNGDKNDKDKDYYNKVYSEQQEIFECFDVVISRALWNSIQKTNPIIKNGRDYRGLQPRVWTDTLAFEFWKQYRLKCAFVFKKASIPKYGYYATMIGHCKSKKCRNHLFGYIEKDPGEEGPVIIKIECRDTRFEKHEDCKRPLQAQRREIIKEEAKQKCVQGVINEAAKNLLQPGDTQCPVMFTSNVLYQLKKEIVEDNFGVKSEDRRDLIKAVIHIDKNPIYRNSIILLADVPFYLFYATPSQLHCYHEYRRLHRKYSSICIDATGGVVRKFNDSKNERTSAIFLYQIVINFNGTSQSVYQMLSEVHDADISTLWLKRWYRLGANIAHEVVCDGARALLNAISLAFNNRSLSNYIELCFNIAKNKTPIEPITYIRLDTARFIHSISSWKCWRSVLHKSVKSLFMYCIALLINCKHLKDFERIFVLILIICSVEYQDSVINFNKQNITPLNARVELENLIAAKKTEAFYSNIAKEVESINFDSEKSTILNDVLNNPDNKTDTITSWLNELASYPLIIKHSGKILNCFYVPKFKQPLIDITKEFPLWTKICIPHTNLRATTSYVEANFKDLKTVLKKEISLPTSLPIFVKAHLSLLIGGVTIFKSKLTKFIDENIDKSSISVDSNCHAVEYKDSLLNNAEVVGNSCDENWMGLGNDLKHKNFNWINYDNLNNFRNHSLKFDPGFDTHGKIDKKSNDGSDADINEFSSAFENDNNAVALSLNQSIENDHNYSLKTSTPTICNVHENNVFDLAIDKTSRKVKNEGKYFKEFAEVKLLNNLIVPKTNEENVIVKKSEKNGKRLKKEEKYLLVNGNFSGPVKFDNNFWFAYNTCPFDSIIQVLFNGSLENEQFYEFLNNSENSTCKFVIAFMETGLTSEIYSQRFSILYPIYNSQEKKQIKLFNNNKENEVIRSISRVIDCEDNVSNLWNKLFRSEPSMFENHSCSSSVCPDFQTSTPVLTVNYKTIIDNGFNDLEKALNFRSIVYNMFCKNCCNRTQTYQRILNTYIYIELDIKLIGEKDGKHCKLRDLPTNLNFLHQSSLNKESKLCYRLCGAIGYSEHHYIAYCRRITGEWRFYNDLLKIPKPISNHIRILPHGVVYLLDNGNMH